MRERPILFSGPMVRAILDGRKTQTRRMVKPQPFPSHGLQPAWGASPDGVEFGQRWLWREVGADYPDGADDERRCPYGQPGDRLWVREGGWVFGQWHPDGLTKRGRTRWRFAAIGQQVRFERPADGELTYWGSDAPGYAHRPSIFMPRWASRLTLEITDVRVDRVRDISPSDVEREGLIDLATFSYDARVTKYGLLWDSLNAKRGFGWDANPWAWAITFRRATPTPSEEPTR